MRGMEILEALDFIDGKYINEAKTNDYISVYLFHPQGKIFHR